MGEAGNSPGKQEVYCMTSKWTCVLFGLGSVFPSAFLYLTLSLSSLVSFSSTFLGSQVRPGSAGSTSFPGPHCSPSPLQARVSLTNGCARLTSSSEAEILLRLDFQILDLLLPAPEHRERVRCLAHQHLLDFPRCPIPTLLSVSVAFRLALSSLLS